MKLIEFEEVDGKKIYINPEYVMFVSDWIKENVVLISLAHGTIYVKGDPLDVAQKLIRGYSV